MVVPNFDVLCRACMAVLPDTEDPINPTRHDLLMCADLAKKYTFCTSLNVEPKDSYPKYLCSACCSKLHDYHQFHRMCVESLQRFRELQALHESLAEEPVCDLKIQNDLEITVEVPAALSLEEKPVMQHQTVKGTQQKRRGRPSKVKTQQKCEASAELWPKTRPRRKVVSKVNFNERQEISPAEDYSKHCTDRLDSTDDPVESIDSEVEFPFKKKRKERDKRKCDIITSVGSENQTVHQLPKSTSTVFQCDICPTRFFVEHRLIAHKRSHDGLAPYPCPREGCEKSFNRWHCLSEHLKQHEGTNRWYKCEEQGCNKVYKHRPTLAMHLRRYHKRGPELKSHVCEICGKVFKSSAILNDHRYTHKDKSELPFVCDQPQCTRRFSNKEKLKVHLMRHAGIKNFVCPHCGMRKTTRTELKTHINYHTLERTWPCRFCKHIFNSAGNLKMHVHTVHEQAKDYACRYCERTFAKPDTCKYHEMTHTGEKPNECKECGKRFTQPAALRTHKKIHQRQSGYDQPKGAAIEITVASVSANTKLIAATTVESPTITNSNCTGVYAEEFAETITDSRLTFQTLP